MRAKLFIASAAAASLFSGAAMAAEDCSGKAPVTISGTVSNIGTVQEEPGETPQTNFVLVFSKPWCGQKTLIVSLPRGEYCLDGETITMSGEYDPPDKLMDVALFRAHEVVSCELPKDRR